MRPSGVLAAAPVGTSRCGIVRVLRGAPCGWYTFAVPNRRSPRRDQARPMTPSRAAPGFLPPQPLADRDRRRFTSRRWVIGLVAAVAVAIAMPVVVTALSSAGVPVERLGADVAGAVTDPSPTATASPLAVSIDRAPPRRPQLDPDGPRAGERVAPQVASLDGYVWPLRAGRVTLPFKAIPGGTRINAGKRFHDGLDMASFCGDRVGAAHAGVVLAAGRRFDDHIGWIGDLRPYYRVLDKRHMWNDLPIVVVIDDGNGYRSIYAHFRKVTVKRGQHVEAGQLIGYEGATGHASGCHVHYGLFSPYETKTFGVRADILKRLKLPKTEIARIDPLLVLPGGDVALRTRSVGKAIKAATAAAAAARPSTAPALLPEPSSSPPSVGG
jgi:murein DD-endopeptidase MepM/ murein hydrolase activator NlpD